MYILCEYEIKSYYYYCWAHNLIVFIMIVSYSIAAFKAMKHISAIWSHIIITTNIGIIIALQIGTGYILDINTQHMRDSNIRIHTHTHPSILQIMQQSEKATALKLHSSELIRTSKLHIRQYNHKTHKSIDAITY